MKLPLCEINNKVIYRFAALIFLTEFVRGAYMNFLPLYSRNAMGYHGVNITGTVFFVYFLVETLSKIGVGWILDRFNNKIILLIGLIISFMAFYWLKYITTPIQLIIDGAFIGLGFTPVWLMVLGYTSKLNEKERVSSIGIIYSGWVAGLGLGMMTISFMIEKSYSFAINTLISIWLICIAIGIFVNEGINNNANTAKIKTSTSSLLYDIWHLKILLPGVIFQTFGISLLIPIIAIFFTENLKMTPVQYGFAQAAIGIIIIVGLAVLTRFTHGINSKRMFLTGLFATSIAIFAVGHLHNIISIIIFGVIAGIAYSTVLPSWYNIESSNIPKVNTGIMWGIFSTLEGIGRALGPLTGGFIGQNFGLQFSFTASSLITCGIAMFYLIFNSKLINNKV